MNKFKPSQCISRKETASSIARRFNLDYDVAVVFLNWYYPKIFFWMISTDEYLDFSNAIKKTLTK